MKFFSVFLAALMCLFVAAPSKSNAAPIRIDFSISSFDAVFNGVFQSTGDMTLSMFTDTDTPNLGASFDKFKNRYEVEAFVTADQLGLDNERIVSDTYLYFGGSIIGITDKLSYFGSIISLKYGANFDFGTQYDLSTLVIPQDVVQKGGSEFNNENGWLFENGDMFDGANGQQDTVIFSGSNQAQVTAIQVTQLSASATQLVTTPLPAGLVLLLSGAGALGFARRKHLARR